MSSAPARFPANVAPYPWAALDRLSREVVTALPAFRRVLRTGFDESGLARAIGEVTGASVRLVANDIEVLTGPDLPSLHGAAFVLATSHGDLRVGIEVERDLAALLVAKVTARPPRIMDPSRPVDASIVGAVAAIATTALRKANTQGTPLVALGVGALRLGPGERVMRVHASVVVNDEAYAATVTLPWVRPHSSAPVLDPRSELHCLDDLPIALSVIVALATASRAEISALAEGDAFLPGDAWKINREGSDLIGHILLAAPMSERGITGRLLADGAVRVDESRIIPLGIETMQENDNDSDLTTSAEAVLDAPVIVRVEMGAVTLTAREWAALAPGDVIGLEKRLAEPVVLRVGGLEVARGDLVDIEGELGVRIRERRGQR